jgi:hypothetical protein
LSQYLIKSHRRIYVSMDGARAEEAGVSPETKHHPHVTVGPLSFGGAQAVQDETSSTGQTLALLVHGIVSIGGDWSLYPLEVSGSWPKIASADDLEERRGLINALTMADIKRIGESLGQDLTLGDESGN